MLNYKKTQASVGGTIERLTEEEQAKLLIYMLIRLASL